MKRIAIILAIALVTFTSHAWTPWLLDSPSVMALVQSDDFGKFAALGAFVVIFMPILLLTVAFFHPRRLSGRTGEE